MGKDSHAEPNKSLPKNDRPKARPPSWFKGKSSSLSAPPPAPPSGGTQCVATSGAKAGAPEVAPATPVAKAAPGTSVATPVASPVAVVAAAATPAVPEVAPVAKPATPVATPVAKPAPAAPEVAPATPVAKVAPATAPATAPVAQDSGKSREDALVAPAVEANAGGDMLLGAPTLPDDDDDDDLFAVPVASTPVAASARGESATPVNAAPVNATPVSAASASAAVKPAESASASARSTASVRVGKIGDALEPDGATPVANRSESSAKASVPGSAKAGGVPGADRLLGEVEQLASIVSSVESLGYLGARVRRIQADGCEPRDLVGLYRIVSQVLMEHLIKQSETMHSMRAAFQKRLRQLQEDTLFEQSVRLVKEGPHEGGGASAGRADAFAAEAPAGEGESFQVSMLRKQLQVKNDLLIKAREEVEEAERLREKMVTDVKNIRARQEKDLSIQVQRAKESLFARLLLVLDSFDGALAAVDSFKDVGSVVKGVEGIHRQLLEACSKEGLAVIKAQGEVFDPNLHEAMGHVETTELAEDCVYDEVRRGYMLNEKLLRATMVRLAKNPPGWVPPQPADSATAKATGDATANGNVTAGGDATAKATGDATANGNVAASGNATAETAQASSSCACGAKGEASSVKGEDAPSVTGSDGGATKAQAQAVKATGDKVAQSGNGNSPE